MNMLAPNKPFQHEFDVFAREGTSMQVAVRYSVVVPVYNEQDVLPATYFRLKEVMDGLGEPYELLFVNDGSGDGSQTILEALAEQDEAVRVLNFSRNFGHQVAISAGMAHASGAAVVIIDADLQDPPELITEMVARWQGGYDVVYAKRIGRIGETRFKRLTAAVFYRVLRRLTDVEIPMDTGDFRLIDAKVCHVLNSIHERNRFVRGLVAWAGFRQTEVNYVRNPRHAGETKYPLKRMLKLSSDAITSFSDKPLKLPMYVGFLLSVASLLFLCVSMVKVIFWHGVWAGATYLAVVSLMCSGLMLMAVGILGQYVGRIYDDVRARPLYVVESRRGFDEAEKHEWY